MNHLLSIRDLDAAAVPRLFRLAAELKGQGKFRDGQARLRGRTLALIFEKPSLRTRVTFEVAMVHLGGAAVYLGAQEIGLGQRESAPDVARNLSRWVDAVAARVFAHQTVEELARHASIPVINALSDEEHPCQALADFFTLWERGLDLARLRLAWIGDGNNVCHSVLRLASLVGTAVAVATPPGFEPDPRIVEECRRHGGHVTVTTEAREAVEGADVVYTDVWISMGQEEERERRLEAFRRYQLSPRLLAFASPHALVMHCLPAHRGEEIADEVLDGAQSVVLDQAENRLHAQKAVLLRLLGEDWAPAGGDGAGRERP
jgi:ornithine carbamoyltransferase